MRRVLITSVCFAVVGAVIENAEAAPGDLLVTERDNDSVLEFSAGNDLSGATRFATGLSAPMGMCVGPNNDIYVAESGSGEITIITAGGPMDNEPAWASGPFNPAGLWCDNDTVIVCDAGTGVAVDITPGGDIVQVATVLGFGLPLPVSFVRNPAGDLFNVGLVVHDMSLGPDFTMVTPYAESTTVALVPSALFGNMMLGGEFATPTVYDFTAGGDLGAQMPWATLPAGGGVEGLLDANGTLYALSQDNIYDITSGGDLTAATPFATGLSTGQAGYSGMVVINCSNDMDCADTDLCNGAETCVNNECQAPAEPLDCGDEDVCTADSCDPVDGCSNEAIDNCCVNDFDCLIDEICDGASNQCVPAGGSGGPSTTSGGSTSGGGSAGTSGGDAGDGGSDDTAGADGDGGGGGGGCSVTGVDVTGAWLVLFALGAGVGRRRRRA